jgi:hypothetical protein
MALKGGDGTFSIGVNQLYANIGNIYMSKAYQGLEGQNSSEISDDKGTYQQLMLLGNSHATVGTTRRVGVWDQLQIGGATFLQALNVNGAVYLQNMSAPSTPSGGGVIYCNAGALWFKGSSGTASRSSRAPRSGHGTAKKPPDPRQYVVQGIVPVPSSGQEEGGAP